ncbi:MAG: DUF6470 family protein [Tumebacillaceae bacterium]
MIPGNTLTLQINQQFGRIGIDISKPVQEIRQPAPMLEIQQPAAQMQIDQGRGQLQIDGTAAHAALGHRTNEALISAVAQQARNLVLEIIGAKAEEGYQLASIEKGTSIADIARQKWSQGPNPIQFVDAASYTNVDVQYTPRPTQIEWNLQSVQIEAHNTQPEISYTPGDVSVYLAQRNSLQIDVKGKYLNMEF